MQRPSASARAGNGTAKGQVFGARASAQQAQQHRPAELRQQVNQIIGAAEAPAPIAEIPAAVDALHKVIDEADHLLSSLAARLEPVLGPQPESTAGAHEGVDGSCSLSQQINVATGRLRTLIAQLSNTHAALRLT